mgnify:CR=1 FL=1
MQAQGLSRRIDPFINRNDYRENTPVVSRFSTDKCDTRVAYSQPSSRSESEFGPTILLLPGYDQDAVFGGLEIRMVARGVLTENGHGLFFQFIRADGISV